MAIRILSSHSNPGLSGPVNHAHYAQARGYQYTFDATPYPLRNRYDQKLHAIIGALEGWVAPVSDRDDDWLVWIDDDAYFMQLGTPVEKFLPEGDLAICRSPVRSDHEWSAINSGVMLIRRSHRSLALFKAVLATDFEVVRNWWDSAAHGPVMVEGGDQERLLYQIEAGCSGASVSFHPAEDFNARIYQFTRPDEHFICHLASHHRKDEGLDEARRLFGLDQYLLPPGEVGDTFAQSFFSSATGSFGPGRTPRLKKAVRSVRRRVFGAGTNR